MLLRAGLEFVRWFVPRTPQAVDIARCPKCGVPLTDQNPTVDGVPVGLADEPPQLDRARELQRLEGITFIAIDQRRPR